MTAALEEIRAARVEQDRAESRRDRRRRRAVTAVVALPLAGLLGWAVAQEAHDPLAQGSGVLAFGVVQDGFRVVAQQTVTNALGTEFRVVAPAAGSRVGIAFGLHNTGRTDVEVLAVGNPLPSCCGADPVDVASAAPGGSGLLWEPLEPFVLPAGGNRDVGVSVLVPGCPSGPAARNAGALVVGAVPVTWRWLGRTHVTQVPLDFRGALDAAPVCAPD